MIVNCPICGKTFDVLWPQLWRYKKSSDYVCSWHCLRAAEKEGVEDMDKRTKVPENVKQLAIKTALEGGNPIDVLRPFSNNPKSLWTYMKGQMKKTDPETVAKLPDLRVHKKEKPVTLADAMTGMKDAADQFFGACESMGLKAETPEAPRISKPVVYSGMTVREIEGVFGRYRRTDVHDKTYVDFEPIEDTDVMSYTIDQWRGFRKEQEQAFAILGVTL